jgi:hypothetical protein
MITDTNLHAWVIYYEVYKNNELVLSEIRVVNDRVSGNFALNPHLSLGPFDLVLRVSLLGRL